MNSYEFRARMTRKGLLITGHVRGKRPGVPYLEPEASAEESVRVYRLVYRPAGQYDSDGFDHIELRPNPLWRTIRILLPKAQEFVIHSRRVPP